MVDLSGTSIGDTATYTCDIGFGLIGSSVLNCQDGGTWDNSPPVCRRELLVHLFFDGAVFLSVCNSSLS